MNKLIFKSPAEKWEHYLPLGNGRLGAMLKVHPCNEIIQLNEEGIWSGGPNDRINYSAGKYLEEIRTLIKKGEVLQAQEMAFRHLSGTSFNERVYQTAGEFKIEFFRKENSGIECKFPFNHSTSESCLRTFSSELDLDSACVKLSYTDEENTVFTRTSWISAVDDMFFMHVKSSVPGKINFRAFLDRGIWCDGAGISDNFIFLEDSHGIPFCAAAGAVNTDGNIKAEGFTLCGNECSEVLFFIDIRAWQYKKNITEKNYKKSILKNTWKPLLLKRMMEMHSYISKTGVSKACQKLFDRHYSEYNPLWKKMELYIGEKSEQISKDKTVKEYFDDLKNGSLAIVNLYTAFSRYLMIAGSRKPGVLPLTLQGLWNGYIEPPWGSKYTININAQMNYWPACMCNLEECEIPLFELLSRAYKNGKITAQKMYGCRGYVLHHNTDYWGDAAPQDTWLPGTYWVLGAAWLATHIYEHFEYTQNIDFLRKYFYLIYEACLFFVDFLQPSVSAGYAHDGKPYLVINPSVSPENSYKAESSVVSGTSVQTGALCEGCQMDNMILIHLFTSCINAGKKLELPDSKDFKDFEYVLSHLKKPGLNSDGSLMEWNKEVEEFEKGHRHISHLYGLFPGHSISIEKTPELAVAAEKTLHNRLSSGGGHTGWSQAWIINFWASLYKGNETGEAVKKILMNSTLPNLLDNHPPFQIDGNFGALAGIVRMIVQSYIDENEKIQVRLLPAIPSEEQWQTGYAKGIKIKGGYTIDIIWKESEVKELKIYDKKGKILDKSEYEKNNIFIKSM